MFSCFVILSDRIKNHVFPAPATNCLVRVVEVVPTLIINVFRQLHRVFAQTISPPPAHQLSLSARRREAEPFGCCHQKYAKIVYFERYFDHPQMLLCSKTTEEHILGRIGLWLGLYVTQKRFFILDGREILD